jgi:hypothetical protein
MTGAAGGGAAHRENAAAVPARIEKVVIKRFNRFSLVIVSLDFYDASRKPCEPGSET